MEGPSIGAALDLCSGIARTESQKLQYVVIMGPLT